MPETTVLIAIGDRVVEATLWDTPAAARSWPAAAHPDLEDFNAVEKTARLPAARDGRMPAETTRRWRPGYYAPGRSSSLQGRRVLNGIARLGRIDADPGTIAALPTAP